MDNILIILGSYMPKPSPNGICAHQIASILNEKGNNVTIIAKKSLGLSDFDNIDGIDIFRVKDRFINRILDYYKNNSCFFATKLIKFIRILNKFKIAVYLPLWPLISPLYTFRLYKKAVLLHRKHKFNQIISIYNPIDALIVGYLLKKQDASIKLTLYFLDTLSGGITPKYFSRKWVNRKGWLWEKKFFRLSDSILIMESHKKQYYTKKYQNYRYKIDVVGIPLFSEIQFEESCYKINFSKDKINFVYTGMLLKRLKNPEYALALFQKLSDSINCAFHIYGNGDCSDIVKKYQNASYDIKEYGQLDVKDAHNALLAGDFLINIGSLVETQITGKIFEYVSSGKPIISFYSMKNEPSIPYLKKYPLHLLIEEDWSALDSNSNRLINFININRGKTVEFKDIRDLYDLNSPIYTVEKIIS